MRFLPRLTVVFVFAFATCFYGQTLNAPNPQPAHITGTVTDTNGDIIPGATIVLDGGPGNRQTTLSNDTGGFEIDDIPPGREYQVRVSASGFADWRSAAISLSPGQFDILNHVQLTLLGEATSVTIVAQSREELAAEEVRIEEHQRVLGFIPNFYVSYAKHPVPLTSTLKFKLALKISVDPVTLAGSGFVAAIDQASHYPNYQEGMKGYGQRFGSLYVDGLTDIIVGGAILPSILHQDPRYFYQGTGSNKSRWIHALTSPIICRGDNGKLQPNYSSIGGYLASGAIANTYYPDANRGAGLLSRIFGIDLAANVANGVLQEFVLRKLTHTAKALN